MKSASTIVVLTILGLILPQARSYYVKITSDADFKDEIASAGDKLVLVMYSAKYAENARLMKVVVQRMASTYEDDLIVIEISLDDDLGIPQAKSDRKAPAFDFMVKGEIVKQFEGAVIQELQEYVKQYINNL